MVKISKEPYRLPGRPIFEESLHKNNKNHRGLLKETTLIELGNSHYLNYMAEGKSMPDDQHSVLSKNKIDNALQKSPLKSKNLSFLTDKENVPSPIPARSFPLRSFFSPVPSQDGNIVLTPPGGPFSKKTSKELSNNSQSKYTQKFLVYADPQIDVANAKDVESTNSTYVVSNNEQHLLQETKFQPRTELTPHCAIPAATTKPIARGRKNRPSHEQPITVTTNAQTATVILDSLKAAKQEEVILFQHHDGNTFMTQSQDTNSFAAMKNAPKNPADSSEKQLDTTPGKGNASIQAIPASKTPGEKRLSRRHVKLRAMHGTERSPSTSAEETHALSTTTHVLKSEPVYVSTEIRGAAVMTPLAVPAMLCANMNSAINHSSGNQLASVNVHESVPADDPSSVPNKLQNPSKRSHKINRESVALYKTPHRLKEVVRSERLPLKAHHISSVLANDVTSEAQPDVALREAEVQNERATVIKVCHEGALQNMQEKQQNDVHYQIEEADVLQKPASLKNDDGAAMQTATLPMRYDPASMSPGLFGRLYRAGLAVHDGQRVLSDFMRTRRVRKLGSEDDFLAANALAQLNHHDEASLEEDIKISNATDSGGSDDEMAAELRVHGQYMDDISVLSDNYDYKRSVSPLVADFVQNNMSMLSTAVVCGNLGDLIATGAPESVQSMSLSSQDVDEVPCAPVSLEELGDCAKPAADIDSDLTFEQYLEYASDTGDAQMRDDMDSELDLEVSYGSAPECGTNKMTQVRLTLQQVLAMMPSPLLSKSTNPAASATSVRALRSMEAPKHTLVSMVHNYLNRSGLDFSAEKSSYSDKSCNADMALNESISVAESEAESSDGERGNVGFWGSWRKDLTTSLPSQDLSPGISKSRDHTPFAKEVEDEHVILYSNPSGVLQAQGVDTDAPSPDVTASREGHSIGTISPVPSPTLYEPTSANCVPFVAPFIEAAPPCSDFRALSADDSEDLTALTFDETLSICCEDSVQEAGTKGLRLSLAQVHRHADLSAAEHTKEICMRREIRTTVSTFVQVTNKRTYTVRVCLRPIAMRFDAATGTPTLPFSRTADVFRTVPNWALLPPGGNVTFCLLFTPPEANLDGVDNVGVYTGLCRLQLRSIPRDVGPSKEFCMLLRGETFENATVKEASYVNDVEPVADLSSSPVGSKLLHRKLQHQKLRRDFELQRWLTLRMQQDQTNQAGMTGEESSSAAASEDAHWLDLKRSSEQVNCDDTQTEANLDAINASIDRLIVRMDAHIDGGNHSPNTQKIEMAASASSSCVPQEAQDSTAKSKNASKRSRKRHNAEKRKQRKQQTKSVSGEHPPEPTPASDSALISKVSIPNLPDSLSEHCSDSKAHVDSIQAQAPALMLAKHPPLDVKVAVDEADGELPLHTHLQGKHAWLKQWILKQKNTTIKSFGAPLSPPTSAVPQLPSVAQNEELPTNSVPSSPLRFPDVKAPELTSPRPQSITNPFDFSTPESCSAINPFDRYDFPHPSAYPSASLQNDPVAHPIRSPEPATPANITERQTPLKTHSAYAATAIESDVDSEEEAELADRRYLEDVAANCKTTVLLPAKVVDQGSSALVSNAVPSYSPSALPSILDISQSSVCMATQTAQVVGNLPGMASVDAFGETSRRLESEQWSYRKRSQHQADSYIPQQLQVLDRVPPALSMSTYVQHRNLYFSRRAASFGSAAVGTVSRLKVELCNPRDEQVRALLSELPLPFVLLHKEIVVAPRAYVRVPVRFVPTAVRSDKQDKGAPYVCHLTVQTDDGHQASITLEATVFSFGD